MTGATAFVTGGASGIGAATCRLLARKGYHVTIADRQEDAGRAVADAVGGHFLAFDVADPAAWDGALAGVDLVHLNAGVTTGERDIASVSDEQYVRLRSINLDGVVFGARAAARDMAEGGTIVATASVAGLLGFAPDPLYTAVKHGVVGLVRALGPALEPQGIRINAVCPGIVDTPLLPPEASARLHDAGYPLIDPGEVAAAVLAAATSGRTGECWTVLPGRDSQPFTFAQVDLPSML